ncbi:MAG: hypothetical protein JNJ85_10695 [Candidatus Kapabacteria bacterium]|nr:hypothetical protein [Candidatus Kapabacteria bacterium]
MKKVIVSIVLVLINLNLQLQAQSPFSSNKQSLLFSNTQSGASERWISLFAPTSLSANYRLLLPTTAPTAGQTLNTASISGSDYTMQWANWVTGSGTSTQVAYWSTSTALSSSSNLYWDNTNGRLGIGTSSPGQKLEVMNGNVLLNNNNNTSAELRIAEPSTSGSHYTAFKAQAQSSNVTYTLPASDGPNGAYLSTNGSGGLTWTPMGTTIIVRKSADESVTNNTALQDDNELFFSISANEIWDVDAMIRVYGGAGDIKFALVLPTGATMWVSAMGDNDASNDDYVEMTSSGVGYTFNPSGPWEITATGTLVHLHGLVVNSTNAGTVKFQWAQAYSNGTPTTVKINSFIRAERIQ